MHFYFEGFSNLPLSVCSVRRRRYRHQRYSRNTHEVAAAPSAEINGQELRCNPPVTKQPRHRSDETRSLRSRAPQASGKPFTCSPRQPVLYHRPHLLFLSVCCLCAGVDGKQGAEYEQEPILHHLHQTTTSQQRLYRFREGESSESRESPLVERLIQWTEYTIFAFMSASFL